MNRFVATTIARCMSLLPGRVAASLYHRCFSRHHAWFLPQFEEARLRFAPSVKMRLVHSDTAHGPMALAGVYELALTKKIVKLARSSGGIFLDVGANYGYFSLLWCAARPENRAIAVEASPRNIAGLRHNVVLNGFQNRIEICDWAAADEEGYVSFDAGPLEETGWGGICKEAGPNTVTVRCRRVDEVFADQRFAAMKVDCEGADALVLRGAVGLLKARAVSHVFYEECEGRMQALGVAPGIAGDELKAFGYQVECLGGHAWNEFHAFFA